METERGCDREGERQNDCKREEKRQIQRYMEGQEKLKERVR